jgi:polyhydroxybutyrate depolymerase
MSLRSLLLAPFAVVAIACAGAGASTSTTSVAVTDDAATVIADTIVSATSTTEVPAASSSSTSPPTSSTAPPSSPAAVAPAVPAIGETIEGSIVTPDGRTRTYRLYVPSKLPTGPVPLLVALHGGTGWGAQFQRNSGFDGLAEANGFLAVFPDGTGVGADGTDLRTWNAGYCCGSAARNDVDDVAFIDLLIDTIEADYSVDPTRVFAAGHSNGGMLSYRLACELSDRIVAVGLQAGSLGVDACDPAQPVSLLHIHGTEDANHPIEGGVGPNSISGVSYRSADESVRTVAAALACSIDPATSVSPDNPDLQYSTWSECDGGVEVQLLAVTGATHAWMGHVPSNPSADPAYADLDASLAVLEFLLAHPRPTPA